jgi:hypothetical protein
MNPPALALPILAGFGLMALQAQPALDTLFLLRGDTIAARVVGIEDASIRIQKPLPARPGVPQPVFAVVRIPRAEVDRIEFAPQETRDRQVREATTGQLPEIEALWRQHEPWLAIPRSPAGSIGLAYGGLLLRTKDPARAATALALFRQIESKTWNDDERMQAKQGRLSAMVATGQAAEAVREAAELAKLSEDPAVLVEAKFILAKAADTRLRALIEANPRWQEDVFVIPERNRLYHEALDLYLHPYLFFGSESEAASRGLWGACGVYQFTGESDRAAALAQDLVTLYPETPSALQAQKFLDALPKETRKPDPPPAGRPEKKSRSKKHEK